MTKIKENKNFAIKHIGLTECELKFHQPKSFTQQHSVSKNHSISYDIDISVNSNTLPNQLIVCILTLYLKINLKINLKPSEIGYLKVAYQGVFNYHPDIDESSLQTFKEINAPAIMYPYLREFVFGIIQKVGLPAPHLPIIQVKK